MASGAVLLLRKFGMKELVSVNRGLLLNLCTLTHSSSFDLGRGLFCRYKSLGLLNRLLFLSESFPVRASFHCPTSDSSGHVLLATICLLPVHTKNNMRCHDLGTIEFKYCVQNNVCMSTKVSGDKKTGTDTSGNDLADGDTNVKSRLGQTKQLIKETTDKVKEKVEAIIMRENIMTIPNMLCMTRIMLSPFLGYLVLQRSFDYALGVFVFAGLTDLLDGFIARNFKNQQSMLGSFLDPMADKFLVFFLVLSLTCTDLLPVPLTVLIIARDACLLIAGFYIRFLSLPPPKTLSRYFDVSYATAQLSPTFISKINTLVQLSLVACTLASPLCHLENHPFIQAFWYLTAVTTVTSGLSYMFSKNTYHLLRQIQDKKGIQTQAWNF